MRVKKCKVVFIGNDRAADHFALRLSEKRSNTHQGPRICSSSPIKYMSSCHNIQYSADFMIPSVWFSGFIVILLLIGIPSILLAFLSSFYYIEINKIRVKFVRLLVPPLVFIIIAVTFMIAGLEMENPYKEPAFLIILNLLFFAIVSMGTITPFPLFEMRLVGTKKWIYVFVASTITFFNFLYLDLANQSGLIQVISGVPYSAYPPIVSMLLLFIEAVAIASLVYGGFAIFSRYFRDWILNSTPTR